MHVSDRVSSVLWRFAPMIYGPTILFALGEGAVIPLIPILAAERGADVAEAAFIASFLVVGQLCGNIPAGWSVARLGVRLTMAIGGVLAVSGKSVIGKRSFRITAGKYRSVTLRLTKSQYRTLRKRGRLKATVTVTTRDDAGVLRRKSVRLTLKPKKK